MTNNYFFNFKNSIILLYLLKFQEGKSDWDIIDLGVDDKRIDIIIKNNIFSSSDVFESLKYFVETRILDNYYVSFDYKDDISNLDLINGRDIVNRGQFYENIENVDFQNYYGTGLYKYNISLGLLNIELAKQEIDKYYINYINGNYYIENNSFYKLEYQVNKVLLFIEGEKVKYNNSKIILSAKLLCDDNVDLFGTLLYLEGEGVLKINNINFDYCIIFNVSLLKEIKSKFDNNIIYSKLLSYKEDFNRNGFIFYEGISDFQIKDQLYKFDEIDKNLWAGIYLLYAILKEGGKESINDYLLPFKKYRKDKFGGRDTKTSDLVNAKSRLNNFLNSIGGDLVKNDENKFEIVLK